MRTLHNKMQQTPVRPASLQEKAVLVTELFLAGYYSHEDAVRMMETLFSRVRRDS